MPDNVDASYGTFGTYMKGRHQVVTIRYDEVSSCILPGSVSVEVDGIDSSFEALAILNVALQELQNRCITEIMQPKPISIPIHPLMTRR